MLEPGCTRMRSASWRLFVGLAGRTTAGAHSRTGPAHGQANTPRGSKERDIEKTCSKREFRQLPNFGNNVNRPDHAHGPRPEP